MLIRMCTTQRGTPDGFCLRMYREGEAYDLPELLAIYFLRAGYAVRQPEIAKVHSSSPAKKSGE